MVARITQKNDSPIYEKLLKLPEGRCSLQINDQCALFINQLINIYGTPVTWKALCQLMLKYEYVWGQW